MKAWKLIIFLIILGFVVFFAGFNITNVSDISFGFYEFKDIPIFISLFVAFLLGALIVLPFTLFRGKRKQKKTDSKKEDRKGKTPEQVAFEQEPSATETEVNEKKKKDQAKK